jgi:hypothetical protein
VNGGGLFVARSKSTEPAKFIANPTTILVCFHQLTLDFSLQDFDAYVASKSSSRLVGFG